MSNILLANFGSYGPGAPLLENLTGAPAEQPAEVSCAWTPEEFRVRFVCVDADPWATITQRDGPLWEEEVVEVFLDPIGDGLAYFEIEVNPLNTVLDLVLRRSRSGFKKDFAWDCEGLRTGIERTATGWNAELRIPFASIVPEAPHAGTEWRVNFARIDRPKGRERELSAWSPTRLATFHAPERFGTVRFATAAS